MTEATQGTGSWRRLSPWAVLFLLVRGTVRFTRENLPVLIGAGAWVAFVERIGLTQLLAGGLTLLLLALLISIAYYRRFRFRLDGDVLRVQKGLVRQVELKVSASRIQHMAIEQPAWMRPFDIVRLSLDTPGGLTTEVELPGIRRHLAESLRRQLNAAREQAGPPTARTDGPQPELLFRINPVALTLHGLASNSVYLLLAAISPFIRPLENLARERLEELERLPWLQALAETPLLAGALLLGMLILLIVITSVLAAWLRYYGFTLHREGARYLQHSGLVNRQEQTLSAGRLQSIDRVQTLVGRMIGRQYLVCRQYGGPPRADQTGRGFLVPGLNAGQAEQLCRLFLPGLEPPTRLHSVHIYYRRATAVRFLAGTTILALLLGLWHQSPWPLVLIPAALLLAWPIGHLRWKAVGWARTGNHLAARRGLLGRRTTLFTVDRIHALLIRQSWFQRHNGVATLQLTLASGPVLLPYLPEQEVRQLADWALYRVESAGSGTAVDSTMGAANERGFRGSMISE